MLLAAHVGRLGLGLKVVLSVEGADELFVGHWHFKVVFYGRVGFSFCMLKMLLKYNGE